MAAAGDARPIIVKKIKKGGGGHHGGAWKVAYADFVTAMMAFFLLMWLINTSSPEQKRGIADYFAPASVSPSTSGSGGILGGTSLGAAGVMQEGGTPLFEQQAPQSEASDAADKTEADLQAVAEAEMAAFMEAELSLRQALEDMPELADLSRHVIVDQTAEGLRIQLVDQEGRPMFAPGSAEPNERARRLLILAARVAADLPNQILISGHTDGSPAAETGVSNWDLSAARANAARRVLAATGLADGRFAQVAGRAGADPLFPDDPWAAPNRRVSITLKRAAPPLPIDPDL